MRQAILVKFSRDRNGNQTFQAKAAAGTVRGQCDYGLSQEGKALEAVEKRCKKVGWTGRLAGGQLENGDYAFVFVD